MWGRVVLGIVLCAVGGVWIGQGVGSIHGSFMTGESQWAYIGGVTALSGLLVLAAANRARKRRIDIDADI